MLKYNALQEVDASSWAAWKITKYSTAKVTVFGAAQEPDGVGQVKI